jgi:hypothetical protein
MNYDVVHCVMHTGRMKLETLAREHGLSVNTTSTAAAANSSSTGRSSVI